MHFDFENLEVSQPEYSGAWVGGAGELMLHLSERTRPANEASELGGNTPTLSLKIESWLLFKRGAIRPTYPPSYVRVQL